MGLFISWAPGFFYYYYYYAEWRLSASHTCLFDFYAHPVDSGSRGQHNGDPLLLFLETAHTNKSKSFLSTPLFDSFIKPNYTLFVVTEQTH